MFTSYHTARMNHSKGQIALEALLAVLLLLGVVYLFVLSTTEFTENLNNMNITKKEGEISKDLRFQAIDSLGIGRQTNTTDPGTKYNRWFHE